MPEMAERPDFKQFEELVRQYCRRKLTFQAVGLRAFHGILDVLGSKFDGGFAYGLPEMFFDVAMLWEPLPGAKRRVDERGRGMFPSWS
jgi:hypothetical protein